MNKITLPDTERGNFSRRLQQALAAANMNPTSPTKLANGFNVIHAHRPITVHAARKWLVGEAIPTQEKLRDLADMLGVSMPWLRYGDGGESAPVGLRDRLAAKTLTTLAAIEALAAPEQALVADFVRMLGRRTGIAA